MSGSRDRSSLKIACSCVLATRAPHGAGVLAQPGQQVHQVPGRVAGSA
jgi:hypothetical protein